MLLIRPLFLDPRVARAWYGSTGREGLELYKAVGSFASISVCVCGGDSDVEHATILLWHSFLVPCGWWHVRVRSPLQPYAHGHICEVFVRVYVRVDKKR